MTTAKFLPARKNISLGFISITIWCILTAIGYVYTSSLEQEMPLAFMCFIIFGFSTTVFALLNIYNLPALLRKSRKRIKNILIINLTTFSGWVLVIYAIKYIEPSVANTMILACMPITTLIINKFDKRKLAMQKQNYVTAILLGIGVLYLISLIWTGNTASGLGSSVADLLLAIVICLVSGFALSINNIHIKLLSDVGFTPLDILSLRFLCCALFSGLYVLFAGEWATAVRMTNLLPVFFNACVLIIIPQIAIQISLRELEPFTISVIMPFMPVMMFLIEAFNQRLHPTVQAFAGIIAILCISLGGSVFRYRAERIARLEAAAVVS